MRDGTHDDDGTLRMCGREKSKSEKKITMEEHNLKEDKPTVNGNK